MYEVKGVSGQIKLTRGRIIISRKGALGFLSHGLKGDKEIPIKNVKSMQFKKAGGITNGYLQFGISGGVEAKGGIFNATEDENTVMFTSDQQPYFEEIKKYIDSVIDEEPIDFESLSLPKVTKEEQQVVVEQRSVPVPSPAVSAEMKSPTGTAMQSKRSWFENKTLVVSLLILFFPVGLYGLWKNDQFSTGTKWIVTGFLGFCILASRLGHN